MGYISLYTINIFLAKTLYPPTTYSMYGPLKNLFTSACLKLNYGTTKEGGSVVFASGQEMKIFSTVFQDFWRNMIGKLYF